MKIETLSDRARTQLSEFTILFRLGLDLDIEDGGCFDLLSCVESMEDDTHLRPAPGVWPAAE